MAILSPLSGITGGSHGGERCISVKPCYFWLLTTVQRYLGSSYHSFENTTEIKHLTIMWFVEYSLRRTGVWRAGGALPARGGAAHVVLRDGHGEDVGLLLRHTFQGLLISSASPSPGNIEAESADGFSTFTEQTELESLFDLWKTNTYYYSYICVCDLTGYIHKSLSQFTTI